MSDNRIKVWGKINPTQHPEEDSSWYKLCATSGDTLQVFNDRSCFVIAKTVEEADIIAISAPSLAYTFDTGEANALKNFIKKFPQKTFVFISHMFHVDDSDTKGRLFEQSKKFSEEFGDNIFIFHNNIFLHKEQHNVPKNLVYIDHLQDRSRISFFDHDNDFFKSSSNTSQWASRYYTFDDGRVIRTANPNAFLLTDLDRACDPQHFSTIHPKGSYGDAGIHNVFLAPLNIRQPWVYKTELTGNSEYTTQKIESNFIIRDWCRSELIKLLENYRGFIGSQTSWLVTDNTDHDQLFSTVTQTMNNNSPPSHVYYENTVISIYVESLIGAGSEVHDISQSVTEKTFVPLIQGHFILPFGTYNFVDSLIKDYDYQMPEWIDYSYDHEQDSLLRWTKFLMEVKRILNMPKEFLWDKKFSSLELFEHNRKVSQKPHCTPTIQLSQFYTRK